jgi:hypothetical protein
VAGGKSGNGPGKNLPTWLVINLHISSSIVYSKPPWCSLLSNDIRRATFGDPDYRQRTAASSQWRLPSPAAILGSIFGYMVRFRLHNMVDELVKFDMVVNALPKECLRTLLDLDSYKTIKERLCDNHQLTEFQPVEKLHAMEALGDSVLIQCTVRVNVPKYSWKDLFLLILLYPRKAM